jgi:hypothetical protein
MHTEEKPFRILTRPRDTLPYVNRRIFTYKAPVSRALENLTVHNPAYRHYVNGVDLL